MRINDTSSDQQISSGNYYQTSQIKNLNSYKVPSYSISSSNSSNNYKMIGDFGHISPIIKH